VTFYQYRFSSKVSFISSWSHFTMESFTTSSFGCHNYHITTITYDTITTITGLMFIQFVNVLFPMLWILKQHFMQPWNGTKYWQC